MLRWVRLAIIFILTAVVLETVVNVKSDWLWSDIFTKTTSSQTIALTVLGLMLAAIPIIWRIEKRSDCKKEFRLIKRSEKLTPPDLNFEIVESSKTVASVTHRRPYAPGTYLQRSAVPYALRLTSSSSSVKSESDLCQLLRTGKNLLLVGPPTDGKTRTLLELVDRMRGYSVVIPHHDTAPSQSAIQLLRSKRVILLLDDLKNYESSAVQLIDLYRRIGDIAASCVMLATSRVGPDYLTALSHESGLDRLFEHFDTYALAPATIEQQQNLAGLLNQAFSGAVPTLGFISMRDAFELMRKRFDALTAVTQDCFRALQLLAAGGVEPYETPTVHIVVKSIFGRNIDSAAIRDALTQLATHDFIANSSRDPTIHPHTAYLVGPAASMFYGDQSPESALADLARCFHEHDDFRSANKVGVALFVNGRHKSALDAWATTIELAWQRTELNLREAEAHAFFNRGTALSLMNDADGSLSAFDALLKEFNEGESPAITQIIARTLAAKSHILATLKRYDEALETSTHLDHRFSGSEDLEIRISVARGRQYAAGAHALTKNFPAAEAVYAAMTALYDKTTVPELQEILAFAMKNQARIWTDQGQHERAITRLDEIVTRFSVNKRPGMANATAQALLQKASILIAEERSPEAIVPLEQLRRDFVANNSSAIQARLSVADRSAHAIHSPHIDETISLALSHLHTIYLGDSRHPEAEDVLTQLLDGFKNSPQSHIKIYVINALKNKAVGHFSLGDWSAGIDTCHELGRIYASDTDTTVRDACATNLFGLGDVLFKHHIRPADAVAVFTLLANLFKQDTDPNLRVAASRSMVNASLVLIEMNQPKAAIEMCEQVISLFSAATEINLRQSVVTAHGNRALAIRRMGLE